MTENSTFVRAMHATPILQNLSPRCTARRLKEKTSNGGGIRDQAGFARASPGTHGPCDACRPPAPSHPWEPRQEVRGAGCGAAHGRASEHMEAGAPPASQ